MFIEQVRYSRLAEITRIINTKLELADMLQHVATAISEEIVQCDSIGIYLPDSEGVFRAVAGKPEAIDSNALSSQRIDFDKDLLANEIATTKRVIYIPDTSVDTRPHPGAVAAFNVKSLLGLPITYEQHLYGLVFLFDNGKKMELTELQIQSVEAYVNMAAVAIQNAANLKQKEQLLAEKQMLLDANNELANCSTVNESLKTCFRYIENVISCKNIAVFLRNPMFTSKVDFQQMNIESEWTKPEWERIIDDFQSNTNSETVVKEIITKKNIRYVPNEGNCRLILIPFLSKGEVIGIIAIACSLNKVQSYEKSQINLAQSIINATAITISNLTYMDQLEHRVRDRTLELANANEKVTSVIESITDGFFALNENWEFIYINNHQPLPEGRTAENVLGEKVWSVFPERFNAVMYEEFSRAMLKRVPSRFEISSVEDGYSYDIVAYPFDEGICCMCKNTTDLKIYENELKRLSNLELIGQMAAGISHEIRNPMTTVRGFLQLLTDNEGLESYNSYFNLMIEELDRANSIISEFLSVGNTRSSDLKMQNLNAILTDIAPLLKIDTFSQNKFIEIETMDLPDLLLNRNEIRQLLINICRNGLEAMQPGEMLSIRTYLENGNMIVLEIEDEGEGMSEEVLKKIGTPFYTTKDNGTGLGLGVSYAIAARHKAKIDVQSGIEGTIFSFRFPL
ncbi:sensor histidine kinase [Planococcus sp. PAMC 21323]|uniref:GAF domain-containing sensor histidine kinase n=1 Tax=Planococcus sp. PAMC 21323 TaxID=1526927 RepID=UPI00056E49DA|nr:GAF domain-containing sensor histidine kinase [Planococcus sp. PAMC 21323]AIY05379.1 sensor histidine kinase [Planococcus sp. PAMC 21323]